MRRQTYFILIFLFFACCANGQTLKFYRPIGDISQNSITSIVQDQKGFLWFGSKYGLNKYNGVSFQTFLHDSDDSTSLTNSSIESLLVDNEGNIWVGTFGGGINLYNVQDQTFAVLHPVLKNALIHENVFSILEDKDGDIWFGTENSGIFIWNKKTTTLEHFNADKNKKNSLPINHINKIEQDDQGLIWIATWGGGLCRYDQEKNDLTVFNVKSAINLNHNIVRTIHTGKEGRLWVGTQQGIQYLEYDKNNNIEQKQLALKDKKIQKRLNQFVIISILEDSNDRLWIGTENNGLLLYHLKTQEIQQFKYNPKENYSIQNNSIWNLFEDQQGTIWIGLFKNGINKVDPFEQKFNHISDGSESKINLSYGLVSSFAEDQHHNLWVGTDGGGLNFIDRSQLELTIENFIPIDSSGLKSKEIVCMVHDKDNQLWIGTWGEGLFVKDQNNNFKSFVHDPENSNSLSGNFVMAANKDHHGNIWIATHRVGLDLYIPSKNQFFHFNHSSATKSISSDKISTIVEDQNEYIWLGTEGEGIDRIKLNNQKEIISFKNYKNSPENKLSLSNDIINSLYVDSKNRIWVATDGGGISLLENNGKDNFQIFSKKDGLPSDVVYGILEETPSTFWISTNAGLASINLKTNEIKSFDLADGLQAKEFNKTASFQTSDNTFLFGGINGFNYFKPKEIRTNYFTPPVFITKVEIQNKGKDTDLQQKLLTQLQSKNFILESDENDLRINFAALNYSQSTKNQYAYQLENYDTYWQGGKNITSAAYTNIPPGNYIFKVKASNNDQIWNETATTINIQIKNPWFKSWWAYLTYCTLIFGFLFFINRTLIQRERLKNELKVEHYQMERMQELNKTRSQFFANISHEFKTPLTLIISPLKAIQKKLEKIENKNQVNVMLRNAERLLRLINQILDLSKLESGITELKTTQFDIVEFAENMANNFHPYSEEQFITFELDLPEKPIPLYFEKDKMEKILINLISNAFKYTPAYGKIILAITPAENQVVISLKDTGIGISSDQIDRIFNRYYQAKNSNETSGTGIGLSLTKQLVELHGGMIKVTSSQNQGTQFQATFPMGKSHLSPIQVEPEQVPHSMSEDSQIELKEFNISTSEVVEKIAHEDNSQPLILIVEDNPDIRAFAKAHLETSYQIIEAENGKQGYEMAKQNIPDIIITDLRMPEMNGFELCEKIRNDEKTSHISIIMLTVKSSDESKEMGFEYGADYYLTKPFNPKSLNLRINNILNIKNKYINQVLTNLKNNLSIQQPEKETNIPKITSKDELFIGTIEEIINQNIENSDFQIEDLCREIGFSKSQLYRKMKGLIGQSANEFIRTIRLKKAAELLLTKQDMSISEITYKVGFNDLQYFRSCFKKQYGITPSEYIKN
jgi:signal transduction histidine kinase/ligand-binding sensor domain-containing protein/CheY-like chemotaxis protein/AraC-like DNA-binding protein